MKSYSFALVLVLIFSSCSKKNEVELLQEGKTAQDSSKFLLAIESYQEIINRFQGSMYADSALYRIAVIYNNDLHDYGKAVQSYQRYYALFPKSKEAPTALFLSAFILNNELHQLDSAKLAYETFLRIYPNHSLASSAKFELETLGKDPGEFVKKEVVSSEDESAKKPGKARKQ